MAFGLKYLQGAENDKRQSLKKALDDQSADDTATAPSSAAPAASAQPTSTPSSGRARFQRSAPASTPAPAVASRASAPQQSASPAPVAKSTSFVPKGQSRRQDEGEELYAEQQERYAAQQSEEDRETTPDVAVEKKKSGPSRFEVMGMRARRLVQMVGEFKKWPADQLLTEERRAMREPEAVTNAYLPIYKNEIEPHRQKGYRNLEEAVKKNPNDVVFLLVKGDAQRVRQMSPVEAGAQSVLHGAVLESVGASATLFDAPSSLFPAMKSPPAPQDPSAGSPRPTPKP